MRYVKWIAVVLILVVFGGLLHYTLPRHDVVRVVGVETRLETFGINRFFYANVPSGMADSESRDVRYIETLRPGGSERIFRNEDTGWGWPPYFKMDSADLQARARDLVSTREDPLWAHVTYYGIRSRLFSIYPNALSIEPVAGPEVSFFPWTRTVGAVILIGFAGWVWWAIRRFRIRRVDPFVTSSRTRVRGWWARLRGRG